MKEYKVQSSWTKVLILSLDVNPSRYFIPICSTKSGDIIGRDDKTGRLKYNHKGQLLENASLWDDPLLSTGSQFVVYTESLFHSLVTTCKTKKIEILKYSPALFY
ncbi:hypothetical protein MtrunA17_Chr4g0063901 [Medicago truncatula]|nr:hypothetical protein MtrunA17_Chr4g0063901 [Medicago truncatula]